MKSSITTSTLAVLAGISLLSQANGNVTIDWVRVENLNNPVDPLTGSLYGAVSYGYKIGKYEVTNHQYTVFLNAVDPGGSNPNGIWNTSMGSDARGGISYNAGGASGAKYSVKANMGNKPVNFVNGYDAMRFTNWLHNGQGSGSTETGAYTLNGNTGAPTRNPGATVWLPSENEWYKAAYYDPTPGAGGGDNYWLYPTQSNTPPTEASANSTGDISNPGANVANYNYGADWNGQNGNVTTVGSAGANNYYGTFDMGGNVWEWNEAISGTSRGLRAGSWGHVNVSGLASSNRPLLDATTENNGFGFRVAAIPEPSGLVLTMLIGAGFVCHRRRSP